MILLYIMCKAYGSPHMSCAQNMRDALFIAAYAAKAVQSELCGFLYSLFLCLILRLGRYLYYSSFMGGTKFSIALRSLG